MLGREYFTFTHKIKAAHTGPSKNFELGIKRRHKKGKIIKKRTLTRKRKRRNDKDISFAYVNVG